MKYTTFTKNLWNLKQFDTIGYDKENKILRICYFDGTTTEHQPVEESTVFNFILSKNKEDYLFQLFDDKYMNT